MYAPSYSRPTLSAKPTKNSASTAAPVGSIFLAAASENSLPKNLAACSDASLVTLAPTLAPKPVIRGSISSTASVIRVFIARAYGSSTAFIANVSANSSTVSYSSKPWLLACFSASNSLWLDCFIPSDSLPEGFAKAPSSSE